MSHAVHKRIVTLADISRVALGWSLFGALLIAAPILQGGLATPIVIAVLAVIIATIIVCAFGVVKQAEALAARLGDPYGSLVLTLSVVMIEVILISAVMLGPGEHPTIARDSVMAVSMIIMNLVVGLSLLAGGLRHDAMKRDAMKHNRTGTSLYLSMLIVLVALAFALPAAIGTEGSYTAGQAIPIIVLTLLVYAFFLYRQMGAQADDFRETDEHLAHTPQVHNNSARSVSVIQVIREHRKEIIIRLLLLVITMTPIVLLSHDMATLLDDTLTGLGAPAALAGVLIAMIVFLPESITSVRAALAGEVQRMVNLCHGALVSTVGITIPSVLTIGFMTGQTAVLAESPANLVMLALTLLVAVATFAARRVTVMHGVIHLMLFAVYGIVLFS
ncbi:calcium:proton antiporter [Microbacterium sp. YY-01]|uniref:calcium:proton antiporter n=1 Tax=Microbacterium sp. YY-01 TaxID=3421634 RepID=UPI003D1674D5